MCSITFKKKKKKILKSINSSTLFRNRMQNVDTVDCFLQGAFPDLSLAPATSVMHQSHRPLGLWLCNCGWLVCMPFLGVERNGTYRTYMTYKIYRTTSNWSQEVPLIKSRHVVSKHRVLKTVCMVKSGIVRITFENPRMRGTWELRQYGTERGRPMSLVSLLPQGGNSFISGMAWRIIYTIQSFSICIFIKVINVIFYWIKLFYQICYRSEQCPYLLFPAPAPLTGNDFQL